MNKFDDDFARHTAQGHRMIEQSLEDADRARKAEHERSTEDNAGARVNLNGRALLDMEATMDDLARGQEAERERYRVAILGMLDQALDLQEMEELVFLVQLRLERRVRDRVTAAKAISAHIGREIANATNQLLSEEYPAKRNALRANVSYMAQIRDRWLDRLVPRRIEVQA